MSPRVANPRTPAKQGAAAGASRSRQPKRSAPPKPEAKTKTKPPPKPRSRKAPGERRVGPDGSPNPTSTFSARLATLHEELGRHVQRLLPHAEPIFSYRMHGWRAKRPRAVAWTTGTIDPNWFYLLLAERKQGITVHMWNPFDPGFLKRHAAELKPHGLTPMVGCIQHARKGAYPVQAIVGLLEEVRAGMDAERRQA